MHIKRYVIGIIFTFCVINFCAYCAQLCGYVPFYINDINSFLSFLIKFTGGYVVALFANRDNPWADYSF